MWWLSEKGDEDFATTIFASTTFVTRFRNKILRKDFATSCNLVLRCFIAAAKHVIHSGLCPTTITADFALGKTVSLKIFSLTK
jgi:hypothetical protein